MAKKSTAKSTRPAKSSPRKKGPPKPNAKNKNAVPGTTPGGKSEVVIRMYRQGLGDCFLLAFPPVSGTKPVYVLIDCGVLQKTEREAEKMCSVVQHIKKTTDGAIDLLIVTHEHWDHVSGFSHAQDLFQQFKFDRVWLSWAENLQDPLARTVYDDLAKKKKKVEAALGLVAQLGLQDKFQAASDDPNARRMNDDIETTKSILGFLGMADGAGLAAAKRMTLGQTMNWVRSLVKPGDFCSPGERRSLPGTAGVNVYVLGPPRDEDLIKKMDATGEAGYAFQADRVSLTGAIDHLVTGTQDPPPGPFDLRRRITREQAVSMPFFRDLYGFTEDQLGDEGEAWRRIDDEWLVSGISQLAIQIDQRTNNSSLAVAFELPDGRTLIFPGDAQFGNWFSWNSVVFKDEAGKAVTVTTKQLLNRAVFYKVGHHGSHNATRPESLHEMTSGDLVAMIPTDEQFALQQNKKGSWRMPAQELNDDLKKYTSQRILRADRTQRDLDDQGKKSDAAKAWDNFVARVNFAKKEPLLPDLDPDKFPIYVEYHLSYEL
jgi:beta-lactamase superfamily II metal-dependent hydrolase